MRSDAKASSAGPTSGRDGRIGPFVRGAFDAGGASAGVGGSGAPSRRASRLALVVAIAILSLLALAPLSQAKILVNGFGTPALGQQAYGGQFGTGGGIASEPQGIAVNTSGVGAPAGTAYVVDQRGRRVERFGSAGAFERLWGQDVIAPVVNEAQKLTVSATGGTYTLTFKGETTDPIPFAGSPSGDVRPALAALSTIGGSANVEVSGNPVDKGISYVAFTGALAGTDQPQLEVDASQLTGTVELETLADGTSSTSDSGSGFEICAVATECQVGLGSEKAPFGNGGLLNNPGGIAVDQETGDIYVADSIGANRITEFDPDGSFIRAFGWDVVRSGGPGDLPGAKEEQKVTINASATGGKFLLSFGGEPTGATGGGKRTSGSNVIKGAFNPNRRGTFAPGQVLTGTGIPANTTIVAVEPESGGTTKLTLSAAATSGAETETSDLIGHDIPWDASPAQVQTALEGIPSIGAGNVSVTSANPGGGVVGGPYTVTFRNDLADTNVAQLTSSAAGLQASTKSVAVSTLVNGKPGGFEVCTVVSECKNGAEGANGGEFHSPNGPAFDAAGNLWVADPGNRRVQKFDPSGNFIAAYGYNVDKLGGSGALETCVSTAEGACQAGTQGSAAGQFSANRPLQIALDSSGDLYAIDDGNKRVQKFNPSFTTATTFGSSTFFGSAPRPGGAPVTDTIAKQVTSLEGGTRLAFAVEKLTGFFDREPERVEPHALEPAYEQQVLELDPADESLEDTSLAGEGVLLPLEGLAGGSSGRIYATAKFGFNPFVPVGASERAAPPRQVLVLGETPPPAPVIALKEVTAKSDTTATLKATVDPNVGLVSCKFQYSTDQSSWTDLAAPGCDSFQSTGVQALHKTALGLVPNTHYFFRLQVSRPGIPNSTVTSLVKSFDTDSVAPVVTDVSAEQIGDTSARMVGTIDPKHSATGYVFEYGTTPSLGSSTAPLAIGEGSQPITVSQVVGGLAKDTAYYYRLVASNGFGPTASPQRTLHTRSEPVPPADPGNCANEARRSEQSSTYLPDCRAYEMVTPPDKNQGGAAGRGAFGGEEVLASVSADGKAVAFCTSTVFGEPASQVSLACAPYVSHRGAGGWSTANPMPPACIFDPLTGDAGRRTSWISARSFDRIAAVIPEYESCASAPLEPGAPLESANLYRGDLSDNPFSYELLNPNPNPAPLGGATGTLWVTGGSADLSHVVFITMHNQTADSPSQGAYYKVYDWEEAGQGSCAEAGGCVHLVSVEPGGEPFTTPSNTPGYSYDGGGGPLANAVSEDGERIYFHNASSPVEGDTNGGSPCSFQNPAECDLYMREGDETTFHVSESECSEECGVDSSPDNFVWATPEGDRAFFDSCAKLTDASSQAKSCGIGLWVSSNQHYKLYRWDGNAPPGHHLVDLTVDREPADGLDPDAVDIVGTSTDKNADPESDAAPGNTVYFVGGGQLVSGEPAPNANGEPQGLKLYRWRWRGGSPSVDYLGPYVSLTPNGEPGGNFGDIKDDPNLDYFHVRVTSDGRYLAIQTRLRLDLAVDRDSDVDMYRWDEADGWTCISCQLPGVASMGNVDSTDPHLSINSFFSEFGGQVPEHTISEDGKRIFFTTPDALVPEDLNGEGGCQSGPVSSSGGAGQIYTCQDVYEWNDGRLSLLSSGSGSRPFQLIGADADGKNVYVATGQRLVGWDVDNGVDIYDIRTDGGFPEPAPQPPTCEGESCRGAGTAAPVVSGAGTAVFEGPGNPKPQHGKPRKKQHRKRHPKAHKRNRGRAHTQAANRNRRAGR